MRIIVVDGFQMRRFGKEKVATSVKLVNGLTRGNHRVLSFSDRDVAALESRLGLRDLGRRGANRRLIETCDAWRPDFLLLGHCDIIRNETLREIRALVPDIRIAYRNVDPPFDAENLKKVAHRRGVVDAIFMTTGGDFLRQYVAPGALAAFIPNPTDPAVEYFDVSGKPAAELPIDLIFCGVGNPSDERVPIVGRLHEELRDELAFHSYGMYGRPAIWGYEYDVALSRSKMGLNLNRIEGHYLYSSARISQLMGNGLLTFIDRRGGYARFFDASTAVLFEGTDELLERIRHFHRDDAARRDVAARGRAYYQSHFSGQRVGQFMIETVFELPYSADYVWADQVFRA
jgi:hypothetical protein